MTDVVLTYSPATQQALNTQPPKPTLCPRCQFRYDALTRTDTHADQDTLNRRHRELRAVCTPGRWSCEDMKDRP